MEVKRVAENGKSGMRKKKQQSQKQRPRSWFQNSSISGSKYSVRNSRRGCLQGKSEITQ